MIKIKLEYMYWHHKKKRLKYMKFFIFLSQVFIFWNRCMIALLSMLAATSFSMYTAKQSLNYWAPIQLPIYCALTSPKKKPHAQIPEVFKFPFTSFYILKLLYDNFVINASSYIFFNIHCQAIMKLLISHSITYILPK